MREASRLPSPKRNLAGRLGGPSLPLQDQRLPLVRVHHQPNIELSLKLDCFKQSSCCVAQARWRACSLRTCRRILEPCANLLGLTICLAATYDRRNKERRLPSHCGRFGNRPLSFIARLCLPRSRPAGLISDAESRHRARSVRRSPRTSAAVPENWSLHNRASRFGRN